jgi:hypothetical protein|tara:strand:- start:268 stop:1620 length:1353 start_codon:yes stop_codon:yes gene_type:complete
LDNLQHIDNLLKRASQVPANALVNDSDWTVVEKRLKQRKNRIFFMWFFLALVSTSVGIGSLLHYNQAIPVPLVKETTDKNIDLSNQYESAEKHKDISKSPIEDGIDIQSEPKSYPSNISQRKSIQTTPVLQGSSLDPIITESLKDIASPPRVTITPTVVINLVSISIPRNFSFTTGNILDPKTISNLNWDIIHPTEELAFVSNTKAKSKIKPTPSTKGYWEVGFAFTPSISNKLESENEALAGLINRNYYNFIADGEKSSFSNNLGLNFQYHTNQKWYIASGLFFSQRSESVNYDYVITEFPLTTNTKINGYVPILDPENHITINYQGSNSYHFIEIPLNVGFKQPISPKFEIRSQIGVSYMALQTRNGKKGNFTTLELKDLTELDLNTRNIAANIKSGLYYNTPHLAIGLEPMFGINLNSLNNEATSAIKTKPYSYGINLTTNIKLIKR